MREQHRGERRRQDCRQPGRKEPPEPHTQQGGPLHQGRSQREGGAEQGGPLDWSRTSGRQLFLEMQRNIIISR